MCQCTKPECKQKLAQQNVVLLSKLLRKAPASNQVLCTASNQVLCTVALTTEDSLNFRCQALKTVSRSVHKPIDMFAFPVLANIQFLELPHLQCKQSNCVFIGSLGFTVLPAEKDLQCCKL